MQQGMNAVRSSEAKVGLLVLPYFLLCLLYAGDYFVQKEALVQLCLGKYKSRTDQLGSLILIRIAPIVVCLILE